MNIIELMQPQFTSAWMVGFIEVGIMVNVVLSILNFLVTVTVISTYSQEDQQHIAEFVNIRNKSIRENTSKWRLMLDHMTFLLPFYNIIRHIPFIFSFFRGHGPNEFLSALMKRDGRSLIPIIKYYITKESEK